MNLESNIAQYGRLNDEFSELSHNFYQESQKIISKLNDISKQNTNECNAINELIEKKEDEIKRLKNLLELVNNSKKLNEDILASLSSIKKPVQNLKPDSSTVPTKTIPESVINIFNQAKPYDNVLTSSNQMIIHEKLEIRTQLGNQVDITHKNSVIEIPVDSNDTNRQDPRKTIVGKWSKKHQSFQLLTYDENNTSQTIEGINFDQLKHILNGNFSGDNEQGNSSVSIDITNSNKENVDININLNQPLSGVFNFNFQNNSNENSALKNTTSDLSKLLPALFQNIENKNEMDIDPEPQTEEMATEKDGVKESREKNEKTIPCDKKEVKEKHVSFKRNSQLEKIIEVRNESVIKEAKIDSKFDKIFEKRANDCPEQASEIEKDKKNIIDNFKFLINYDLCKSEKNIDCNKKTKEKKEKNVEMNMKTEDNNKKMNKNEENSPEVLNKSFDIYDDLDYDSNLYGDENQEPEPTNEEKTEDLIVDTEKIEIQIETPKIEETPKNDNDNKNQKSFEKADVKSDAEKKEVKSKPDDKTKSEKETGRDRDRNYPCMKHRSQDIRRDNRENRDSRHSKSQTPNRSRSPHRRNNDRSRHHLSASSTSSLRNRDNQSKYSTHSSSRNDSKYHNSLKTSPRSCKYDNKRDDGKKRKLSPVHSRLSFDDNRSNKHKKV